MDGYPQEWESIVLPISFKLSSTHSYASSHGDVYARMDGRAEGERDF